jgi:hypothetical protein
MTAQLSRITESGARRSWLTVALNASTSRNEVSMVRVRSATRRSSAALSCRTCSSASSLMSHYQVPRWATPCGTGEEIRMTIPTEPIGSLPRPPALIDALHAGTNEDPRLDPLYDEAVRDTIARFEETGSPVITDGEQRRRSACCSTGSPLPISAESRRAWCEPDAATSARPASSPRSRARASRR